MIIWYDATDEMWFSAVQSIHQGVQLLGVEGGDSLSSAPFLLLTLHIHLLLSALTRVVPNNRNIL